MLMENHYWNDAFCKKEKNPVPMELKVVLFLFLMTREADYGWNISSKFQEAIKNGKWIDRRGLGDLKYENKVNAALKQMEASGLIYKSSELKTKIPPDCFINTTTNAEICENSIRHYYSINPRVFFHSAKTDIPADYHEDEVNFNSHFLMYSPIYRVLRLVQGYKKDDMKIIELINRLPKFDYLTILTTITWICRDAIEHYPGYGPTGPKDVSPSFFNNPKRYMKILTLASKGWEESDMMKLLTRFEKMMGQELIHAVYTERAIV